MTYKASKLDVGGRFPDLKDFEKKKRKGIAEAFLVEFLGGEINSSMNCRGKDQNIIIILNKTPQALFALCSARTLNLCGIHAVEPTEQVKTYSRKVQKFDKFFLLVPHVGRH